MTIKIHAAEEAEYATSAKKHGEEAAELGKEARKIRAMTPEEFMEYYYNNKKKNKK